MSRTIILFIVMTAAACTDDVATQGRAQDVRIAGGIATFEKPCPVGSDCYEPAPCKELDETQCKNRSDCEAVYDPSGTTDGFIECRDKIAPVCVAAGKSCTADTCCPGLFCCDGPGPATGNLTCASACPL